MTDEAAGGERRRRFVRGGERPAPQPARIIDVRPYELHGTRYYAVLFAYDADPERPREARVSHEMVYESPQPGDRVLVTSVLGVVDQIARAE